MEKIEKGDLIIVRRADKEDFGVFMEVNERHAFGVCGLYKSHKDGEVHVFDTFVDEIKPLA